MNNFLRDVLDQPTAMKKAVAYYLSPQFRVNLEKILKFKYSKIIFTGMGSSNFGSIPASLYLNSNKITSFVMSSGQLLHYGMDLIDEETLLIMVSQSGESAEIVGLLEKLGPTINIVGITNDPESTLYKKATVGLLLNVENEESVTTRTYLGTLIINNLLTRGIVQDAKAFVGHDLEKVVEELEFFVEESKTIIDHIGSFFTEVEFISCVGRGPALASALAAGLFFKEVGKFPSEGMDSAEFRHGPMEIADHKFGAIVFAPAGKTGTLSLKLAMDIAQKGGKVVLITNMDNMMENDNIIVLKYHPMDEYLSPIIEIVGAQFICNVMAEKKGFVPGEFRWSTKITSVE